MASTPDIEREALIEKYRRQSLSRTSAVPVSDLLAPRAPGQPAAAVAIGASSTSTGNSSSSNSYSYSYNFNGGGGSSSSNSNSGGSNSYLNTAAAYARRKLSMGPRPPLPTILGTSGSSSAASGAAGRSSVDAVSAYGHGPGNSDAQEAADAAIIAEARRRAHAPPRYGTTIPMMFPPPRHIPYVPLHGEPLKVMENVVGEMMVHDSRRMSNPRNVMNEVVYDTVEAARMSSAASSSSDAAADPAASADGVVITAAAVLAGSSSSIIMAPSGSTDAALSLATVGAGAPDNRDSEPAAAGPTVKIPHARSIPSFLASTNVVIRSSTSQVSQPEPYYHALGPSDDTVVFESRFESGNLRRAVRVYEYEYDLILQFDINTKAHTQWYYFRVSNLRKGQTYKFNIINLLKPDSMYNYGLQPLIYSEYLASKEGKGWHRGGHGICYYQNHIRRSTGGRLLAASSASGAAAGSGAAGGSGSGSSSSAGTTSGAGGSGPGSSSSSGGPVTITTTGIPSLTGYYYTLTFSYTHNTVDNDVVYFSHCYPYTYTDLQKFLYSIDLDPKRRPRMRRRALCDTLAGNPVDLITITSFASDFEELKSRKGVVLTARVHPGESNASWMMQGILEFLTGPSLEAKILRDNFVFKVVPMLNPDGVIHGNYRCSLAGVDLNRRWMDPSRKLHPTIYYTKLMIERLREDRDILLFVDLHGHSRKSNVFMYGCGDVNTYCRERVFPRLLWKIAPMFSFQDCHFKVQRSKEGTARVVGYRQLGIANSFTMEASFSGASFGPLAGLHFNTKDLMQMGTYLCESILEYCNPDQSSIERMLAELQLLYPPARDDDDSDEDSDFGGGFSDQEDAPSTVGKAGKKRKGDKVQKKGQQQQQQQQQQQGTGGGDGLPSLVPDAATLGQKKKRKKKRKDKAGKKSSAAMMMLREELLKQSIHGRSNSAPRASSIAMASSSAGGGLFSQHASSAPNMMGGPGGARVGRGMSVFDVLSQGHGYAGFGAAVGGSGNNGGSSSNGGSAGALGGGEEGRLRFPPISTGSGPRIVRLANQEDV